MKGGFGGFPNDIFNVMQGSIYADILCMALACRMYQCIYIYIYIKLRYTRVRAKLSEVIRPAVTGKQSVAAAHSAELRSFRRGCMALRAFEDTVQGWVYDRAFFLRVGLCRRFINKTA